MTSGLSAGLAIYRLLSESGLNVTRVYPVATDEAVKPYVVYRRVSMQPAVVKDGYAADTVGIEMLVVSATYSQGVTLAERVREALDGRQWYDAESGVRLRAINLENAEEVWQDDAFIQSLTFRVKM